MMMSIPSQKSANMMQQNTSVHLRFPVKSGSFSCCASVPRCSLAACPATQRGRAGGTMADTRTHFCTRGKLSLELDTVGHEPRNPDES